MLIFSLFINDDAWIMCKQIQLFVLQKNLYSWNLINNVQVEDETRKIEFVDQNTTFEKRKKQTKAFDEKQNFPK